MKKIMTIKATNKFGKHYFWSAKMLLWDELPRWLLNAIEMELPKYHIEIGYKLTTPKKSNKRSGIIN